MELLMRKKIKKSWYDDRKKSWWGKWKKSWVDDKIKRERREEGNELITENYKAKLTYSEIKLDMNKKKSWWKYSKIK